MHPRRSMSWMLHGSKKNNDLHLADTWHWCVNFSYMQFSALGISYVLHLPLAKALNIKLQMLLAWKVQGSTFSACLQWMWHDVILCWMRKKDCLGNLNAIWWGNLSTVTMLFRIDTDQGSISAVQLLVVHFYDHTKLLCWGSKWGT